MMYFKRSTSFRYVSMKTSRFVCFIVALSAIFTQWGCQPTRDALVAPISQDISIAEAKAWLSKQQTTARLATQKSANRRNEYWYLAKKQQFTNGDPVVVVPVTYNFKPVYALAADKNGVKKKSPNQEDYYIQSKLLIFKDKIGQWQTNLIQIIPTEADRRANKRVKGVSFSGTVLVYTDSGSDLLEGYTYENGKVKGRFRPLSQSKGRMLMARYECGYYLIFDDNDTESGVGFIEVDGEIVRAIFVKTPCSDDDSGGSTGGGFGGSIGGGYGGSTGGGTISGGGNTDGGGYYSGGSDYYPETPIYEDGGGVSANQADNFINMMGNHNPPIIFTEEEKAVIREYPQVIASLVDHINDYGSKPNFDNLFEDVDGGDPNKATLKVVGKDSYNEDTDYRLYERECEAYTYLFNKAAQANFEYGAFRTNKGIIVLPNNRAFDDVSGGKTIRFKAWRIKGIASPVVYSDKGVYTITGTIRTHPGLGGLAEPSTPDLTNMAGNPDYVGVKHYVMNITIMREYFANGSTQPFLSVINAGCP